MNGRLTDVIIEDNISEHPKTGLPIFFGFIVWMDKSAVDAVKKIPGVSIDPYSSNPYFIRLDPRYDREYLRAEIEAVAKINADGEP